MSFQKYKSLKVSERVFDLVIEDLDIDTSEDHIKIEGHLETFNNCREQGLVMFINSDDYDNQNRTKERLKIWVCEARNSDEIMVITSTDKDACGIHNVFTDKAYENRKYFNYNELFEAATYIRKVIRTVFAEEYKRG